MNTTRHTRHVLVLLCSWSVLLAVGVPLRADDNSDQQLDWNQWRGPHRTGQLEGPPWPDSLEPSALQSLWRVELQPSYSGPIVSGERVFVTETVAEQSERVTALNRRDGSVLWTQEWEGAMKVPFFARSRGDWIRATPICDGETVYVAGMRDLLVALDAETGAVRWRVDFLKEFETPLPSFGFVCSPLLDGDDLYVQAAASVVKLNRKTGEVIWRSMQDSGGMMDSAFSSPILENLAGRRQLVVQTRESLAGLDPETGQVLWQQEVPAFRGMNILTPTLAGDRVFTSSYGGRSFLYQVVQDGDQYRVSQLWENKVQGYMSSPVIIDGHVYLHLRNRRFTCLDLETGKEKWITKPFGDYWSLIAHGDRILALDERGELLLIRANPDQFELLTRRQITDQSAWSHLALDRNQLLVRDLTGLTAYRWSTDSSSDAAPQGDHARVVPGQCRRECPSDWRPWKWFVSRRESALSTTCQLRGE